MAETPDTSKLIRAVNRLVRTEDQLSAEFARELARVSRRAIVELTLLLSQPELSAANTIRAAQLSKMLQSMRAALRVAGYDHLMANAANLTGLAQRVTETTLGRQAASLVGGTSRRIAASRLLLEMDLLVQGDVAARALWRAAVNALLGRVPVKDVLADLQGVLDREMRHVATLFDTQVTIVARQVQALQSHGGKTERFVYLGPVDALTRAWCLDRVGKVYQRDEIDEMDNGQLPNPWLTGGGYNCRHRWILLSESSNLRELAGTNTRVPEVQADIDELPKKPSRKKAS